MTKHMRCYPTPHGVCPTCADFRIARGDVPHLVQPEQEEQGDREEETAGQPELGDKRKRQEESTAQTNPSEPAPKRPRPSRFEHSTKYLTHRAYGGMPYYITGLPEVTADKTPSRLTAFPGFLDLPGELQDMIYAASAPPVEILAWRPASDIDKYWSVATPRRWKDVLPLYHVCQRSRDRMLSRFGTPYPMHLNIPFDPVDDVLSFQFIQEPSYSRPIPWIRLQNENFMPWALAHARQLKFVLGSDTARYADFAHFLKQIESMMVEVFLRMPTELRHLTIEMGRFTDCSALMYAQYERRRPRGMAWRVRQLDLFLYFLLCMTRYDAERETFEPLLPKLKTVCLSRPDNGPFGDLARCSAMETDPDNDGYGVEWCVADDDEVDRVMENAKACFRYAQRAEDRITARVMALVKARNTAKAEHVDKASPLWTVVVHQVALLVCGNGPVSYRVPG
jgi:hypothetical protein